MARSRSFYACSSVLAIGLITTVALAATTRIPSPCVVASLQLDGGGGRLQFVCDGQTYWAENNPSCPNPQSFSILTQWQALATTALLSGKKLDIYYDGSNASCGRRLSTVALIK